MKVKFNNKVYEKNKPVKVETGNGLGRLCFDIFKYYLEQNENHSYKELQNIFNSETIHKELSSDNSNRKVIFNENDFNQWYEKYKLTDTKSKERYFGFGGYSNPVKYNNEKLYFTTQWGSKNIPKMIDFADKQGYSIDNLEINEEVNRKEEDMQNNIDNKIKNIILYGSPGVGKTHNTKKLISLMENRKSEKEIFEIIKNNEQNNGIDVDNIKDRVKFITFHQSFGYEDFIEGFRPNEEGNIKLQDGIFKTICDDAHNDRENSYYLVIDEINRGNISKIFGELITLIEEDKRDTLEVILPYSKKPFKIPSNLYIIGTMNSTDKSIALIDIALRRRFTFLKMEPNLDLVGNVKARNMMKQLNEKITDTLGADYVLGHSYFMKIENDDELNFVLEYKIKPLLEEYFYGDEQGLKSVVKIIEDNDIDDTE